MRETKQGSQRAADFSPRGHSLESPRGLKSAARFLFLMLGVAAIVLAAHWPALSARAITFDDDEYLLENHLVQNPGWSSARQFLSEVFTPSTVKGYYQPMAMISLMLDYAMGGRSDDLRVFHRTSLGLHILCTLLVMVFVYQLFGQAWAAALTALVFGVHPLAIESIPWIAERKTLLAAFFAFASLVLYVRYVRVRSWMSYGASLLMCVLALLSKPSSVPLPVLLLILDFWPLRRLSRRAVLEKIPFFAAAGAFAVITYLSQSRTYGTALVYEQSKMGTVLLLCHNIIFYLWKMIWPGELSWYYPYPRPFSLSHRAVLLGAVGTLLWLAALLVSWRWTRAWAVGWFFFFVAIFPTMGVVAFFGLIAADRFVYLPAIGMLMALAWTLSEPRATARAESPIVGAPSRFESPRGLKSAARWIETSLYAAVAVWVLCLAVSTHRQSGYWRDSETLNRRMAELVPQVAEPHIGLAIALQASGRIDESLSELREALKWDPRNSNAHRVMGAVLTGLGQVDEAIGHYREALVGEPDDPRALNNLGAALAKRGNFEDAIAHYRKALEAQRNYPLAHLNLATALLATGQGEEALRHSLKAVALTPDDAPSQNALGKVLAKLGRVEEAVEWFRKAIARKPELAGAHANLAEAMLQLGRKDEALRHFSEAARLKPDDAELQSDIAGILARGGQPEAAAVYFERAAQLRPADAAVLVGLANVLFMQGKSEEAISRYEQVLRLEPDNLAAHTNLAQALLAAERFEEAAAHFQAVSKLAPPNAENCSQLGVTLQQLGRLEEAVAHYQEALRLNPALVDVRNNLGAALADLDRLDEALEQYREGIKLNPGLAVLHANMADVLARQGTLEEAQAKYREAIRVQPDNVDLHIRYGDLLARVGQAEAAKAEYREALRIDPRNTEAQGKLESLSEIDKQTAPE